MQYSFIILLFLSACGSDPSLQGRLENNLTYQQKNISRAVDSLTKTTQLTDPSIAWLEKNKEAFAYDVLYSHHQWVEHDQPHCATSSSFPLAVINLSPSKCKQHFISEDVIAADLIVLSMKHLGLRDPAILKINLIHLLDDLGLKLPKNYDVKLLLQ